MNSNYLYEIDYEIQYKGHFYIFKKWRGDFTKREQLQKKHFIYCQIVLVINFFQNLGFTQSDKFYFDKED